MAQIEVQPGSNIVVTVNKGPLSGGKPAGNIGEVQYNIDGQRFGSVPPITYDAANQAVSLGQNGKLFISGGVQGQILKNAGDGETYWGSINDLTNGQSKISTNNSNVNIAVGGTTITTFTSDGLQVTGDILPTTNVTYDLGSPTQRWRDLYLSNATIDMNGVRMSSDGQDIITSGGMIVKGAIITREFYGNISGEYLKGDGSQITNINGANIVGNVNVAITSGTADTVRESSQPNITSVGNLTSLSVGGPVSLGNISNVSINGGNVGAVLTTDGNGVLSWSDMANDDANYANFAGEANISNVAYSVHAANVVGLDLVVGNAISALVDGAPDALNTLNELANALANDASYSTTIVNSLANKVEFTTFQDYTVITDATIANLATSANLQTLADTTANALANKVDTSTYQTYVDDTANVIANLVTSSTYQTYVDDTANVIANLATATSLQTLADTTANALANKVETTDLQSYVDTTANTIANLVTSSTYQTYVDDTANVIANLVTTDTLTAYQGDVSNTVANLATISYVDSSVSNAVAHVIGGAPAALDTLSELANALGNDASFITTITTGLANKVDTTQYDQFVGDTANTIANLVTTTTYQTYVDDTANTIANLVTVDTFSQYQGDVANAFANTASFQELEDGLANKVYSNVFNDTVANLATIVYVDNAAANLVGTTTFTDTVANLATITYVDDSIANIPAVDLTGYATETFVTSAIASIPPTDLSAYSTTTQVNGLISTALSGHGNIVTVNLTGNTSQLLAGDGTWIDRITLSSANAVSISVGANGAGQSFQDNEFIHYTGNVKPMLFKNGVFVDLGEYSIASNSITFTNNLTVGDQIDVMPTQIAVVSGGSTTPVDLSNYATHQDVADAINLIPLPDLSSYATNTSVDNKIANIPQPNLSAYATNTSVDNKIAAITFPTYGNVANINLNGNAATFLSGNGSWQAVAGGSATPPAGSSTQIQFNNNGSFGASANLIFTDNGLILGNSIPVNKITLDKFGSIGARNVNARDGMTASHAEIGEVTVNRFIAILTDGAPVSSTDTGLKGEVRYDTQYMYLCVADNTWARIPLNTTW